MQMVDDARVVVYLMTGFLESGKTSFLKQTIDKQYFKIDGTTVIILCEEGEEEYEEDLLARAKAKIVTVEDPEELTKEFLQEVEDKYHPERVIFECNGMYPVSKMEALDVPDGWGLIQEITTVDASTFDVYIANMKSLFVEMVRNADMVLFNRCTEDMPLAGYRRSVKVVNQGAQIIFEGAEGEIEDIFSDQMPYDLDAPVIKIEGEFVLGRSAMTCCADDITFLGFICKHMAIEDMKANTWVRARGKVGFEFKRAYRGRGPVITLESLEPIQEPEDELVYFN